MSLNYSRGEIDGKKLGFSVSVLIPLTGFKTIDETIESVVRQECPKLNAQCLISGAFGVFRKSALLEMNGYDTDTVGEDMELVLRLQDGGY